MVTRRVGGLGGRGHRCESGFPRSTRRCPGQTQRAPCWLAGGRDAGVAHQCDWFRVAVLGVGSWPVARRKVRRGELPPADWRFSQDENDDAVVEVAVSASAKSGWIPTFVDYLYVSLTNSSAFSPTDTMPLTSRAKILMGLEATAALMTSLLVIARAVGTRH
jgi:hypothetical protein